MVEGLPARLASEFRSKIERGEWTTGVRLPTNRELAAAYQVSVNTIQHAFRELEAEDLVERRPRIGGYVKGKPVRPNPLRKSTTVGVIGPYTDVGYASDSNDSWGYRIIRGCDRELSASGFHVAMFSYATHDAQAITRILEMIDQAGESLAGVLLFLSPTITGLVSELDRRNIPWVTINRPKEHAAQNFVAHDVFSGARLVARCFARMNFERCAILSDALGAGRSTGDKYFGFLEGWIESRKLARHVDFIDARSFEEEAGFESFRNYVNEFGAPRGVLASGDMLALGAIRACRDLNLSVPNQVAVIGATGLQLSAFSHPPLSVLDTPMEQMGADAAHMLLEMAREGVRRMVGRYAKVTLTIRDSCPISSEMIAEELAAIEASP